MTDLRAPACRPRRGGLGARCGVVRGAIVLVALAGLLPACALVADPPQATYACRADAPACPGGDICILDEGGDGVCGPFSVCIVDEGGGVARRAEDGAPCAGPEGTTKAHACAAGACVELACGMPGYPTVCGDGCVGANEECEDGNVDDGDGCARDCTYEAGWSCDGAIPVRCEAVCGDGIVVADEVCDDGNANPVDGCDEACLPTTFATAPLVSGSTDGLTTAQAELDLPLGIAADVEGVLYVADSRRHRILRFDPREGPAAEAVVIAGNGTPGFGGDGGPAREAQFCLPMGVEVDGFGNVFIADTLNHRIRRVDRDGVITTVGGQTGPGEACNFGTGSGDDDTVGPAAAARFDLPIGLAVDRARGAVYVLDTGNLRVRRLEPVGPRDQPTSWTARTVVGRVGGYLNAVDFCLTGADCESGFCGGGLCVPLDVGPQSARDVRFSDGRDFGLDLGPTGIALGSNGTLYITDTANMRILTLTAGCIDDVGTACTIRTTPTIARLDKLSVPFAIHAVPQPTGSDTIVYTDIGYGSVVRAGQTIVDGRTTIVRDGVLGQPPLNTPAGLTSFGNDLFFVDGNERRVLRVPDGGRANGAIGLVEEVAGRTGIRIKDGVPANDVELFAPAQVAVDDVGAFYTIETLGHVGRRFAPAADGTFVSRRAAGTGQLDLFALLGLNATFRPTAAPSDDPRPPPAEGGDRGQCRRSLNRLALGADPGRGPLGIAVLPWIDGEGVERRSVLVGDTLAQQVLRFEDDGRVCNVLTAHDVGGVDDEFAPQFMHLEGRTLLIVDNGIGRIGASRLAIVTFGEDGRLLDAGPRNPNDPPWVPLLALNDVASVADALPLPDGTFLVADPSASVVWRYTPSLPLVREPYVGRAYAPADDGGDASRDAARLFSPLGLARCPDGRLVIADGGPASNEARTGDVGVRLRVVSADGTQVSTIAGTGVRGFSGDFGPAPQARIDLPTPYAVESAPRVVLGASVGVACAADGTVYFAEHDSQRVRRVAADGTITTVAGRVTPFGPGPAATARLYVPVTFATGLPDEQPPSLVAVDGASGEAPETGAGRVSVVDGADDPVVRLALGYPRAATTAVGPALRAPLLAGAQGAAWDAARGRLVITQSRSTALRVVDVASGDAATWLDLAPVELGEGGLAGIAIDPADGTFVVADEDDHCVRRLSADLALDLSPDAAVVGTCGAADGPLLAPTAVAFSRGGALYVSDTGHNRVVRLEGAGPAATVVDIVGRLRTPASAGEGAPAAEQAVNAPRQLAFDAWDNLFIASTTTVRVVLNDGKDGDDDVDGDDPIITAFGAGGGVYPEREARCITALAPLPPNLALPVGARSAIVVADSCLGAAALVTTVRSAP